MKKLLSVLLVVLMLVGMLPMNAIHTHAAETTETLSIYGSTGTMSGTASISWTSNGVTFTNGKGSTAIRTSDNDHYRLYQNSSVTISAPQNITKIVVTCTSSSYATVFKTSASENGDAATVAASGSTVTITPTNSATSYSISAMTAQTRIKTVAVTYAEATAACQHSNLKATLEKDATCTEEGNIAYWYCSDCQKYFSDSAAATEITEEDTITSALGHNYVNGVCQNCQNKLPTVSFSVPSQVEAVDSIIANENGTVTLPKADDYTGKYEYTFAGWATQSVSDTESKPATLYAAGAQYSPANDITLYAVYIYGVAGTGGSTEYVLTEASKIKAGDTVVITTTKNNSTYYAMSNNNGTSSAPKATEVTVANGKLSASPEDTLKWDVGGSAGQYIFYISGDTNALYCTSTNNGVRVGTNTANTFKIDANSGYLVHNGTGRYIGIYNNADWRCYTSVNTNIAGQTLCFFVESSGGSATYYTSTLEALDTECQHTNTTETTKDATCTAAGSTTVTCDDCGVTVSTTEIPKLDHNYGTGVVTAPTCIAEGYTTYTCSACGHSYTDNKTEPTGEHTYVDGICSVCDAEEPNTGATEWQLVTDASTLAAGDKIVIVAKALDVALSTTQNGNNRGQATVKKSTNTNSIEVVTFGDDVQVIALQAGTTDGTFAFYVEGTSTGYLYAASSGSNYLRTEGTLSANSSWEISIDSNGNATIKAQGSNTRNWLRYNSTSSIFSCYASGQDDVLIYKETLVCEHKNTVDVAEVPATCTTVGYTAGKQCTECGAYTEGHEEIAARGHSYGEGVVTTAPTCTDAGVKTFTCTACGGTKTETVAATGHLNTTENKVDATCTVAGSVTVTCDDCGAVISSTTIPAGHSWDEGKVTTEATCEEPGVMTYTCSVCKETKTEEIAALGHSWDEGEVTTKATCETDGVKTYTCTRDESHTKTEVIPATGHNYVNGVCSVCQKEVSHFQLVTDYTEILAGGEYIVAARVGDNFYAIDSDYSAYPIAVTGTGAEMMVVYADGLPYWNVQYYLGRNNCISLRNTSGQYLAGTDGTGLTLKDSAWAWTFIDGCTENGQQTDGTFAVTQADGSVAYVLASATILDRAISLRDDKTVFMNYSVRTSGYNRELYFFKMVRANVSEYTVKFIENGTTTITMKVPANDNGLKMPQPIGNAMPEGYTKFVGWVEVPHTESMVAPANIFSAEEGDGFNNTTVINEDKTFYALYSREDADGEGQTMDYHLVTDNNQLVVGQKYIIVGVKNDQYYAMSNQLSGDRNGTSVTPDANGVITFTPGDNIAVLELAQGSVLGTYAFLDLGMNQFLYCASTSTENALKSNAALDEKASFVITINADSSYSVITSQAAVDRSSLMFNTIDTNSKIFSCYDIGNTSVNPASTFLYVGVPNSTFATYYTTGLCVHDWVWKDSQQASCTQPGYTMYACSICGEIKMEDVKAHGHTVGSTTVTTEPTCTTTGVATSYCTACNKEFTEILPVIPHTEVVDDAVAASCTATGLTEGKHCSVCDTVLVPQQVAPALGHDFNAAKGTVDDTGNYPVVVYPCSRCEEIHIAAELRFQNASLTLENNIVVNFKAPANVMGEGEYTGFSDLRAEFTYGNRIGENMIKATSAEIVRQADGKYSVPCRRVTPSQIGDKITAVLYGTYGNEEYSYTMTYSAAQYCYDTLKITNDAKLKTLLVDLLYYCDAARAYTTYQGVDKTYKYYGSVTEALTEAQKAYRTVSNEFQSVMGLSGEGEFAATWKSASLILGEATSIRFRVDLGGYDISAVTVKAKVGGKDYTDISVKQDGETYLIQIDGISAHRMREKVEVTLYSGETVISKTVSYSIESYVANKMGDTNEKLVNMLIAMMSYGDAAVAYKG